MSAEAASVSPEGETRKQAQLRQQRERRRATGNAATKAYEKTKRGFLMRSYRNMKSRVAGIQKNRIHIYTGLDLLPKEEFYEMAMADPKFHSLFAQWENMSHDMKYTPSPDRKDHKIGYVRSNIQWLTHAENSAKANKERSQ